MAQSVRRVALAALMALVVLLFTSGAHVGRALLEELDEPLEVVMPPIPRVEALASNQLTDVQKSNTLKMLQAFSAAMPALQSSWTGTSFCNWAGVTCYADSVFVAPTSLTFSGTLPDVPSDVDGSSVMIETITLLGKGTAVSGTLPDSWSKLTNLVTLNLGSTSVSGTLPASWSALTKIVTLSLYATSVSGPLPASWAGMSSLVTLALYRTSVSGTLPPEWSAMPAVSTMQLQTCDLAGSLPASWSEMPSLKRLLLTGNDFCGCVPASWVASTTLRVSIESKYSASTCATALVCVETTTTTTTTTTTEAPASNSSSSHSSSNSSSSSSQSSSSTTTSTTTTTTEAPASNSSSSHSSSNSSSSSQSSSSTTTTTTTTTQRPITPQPDSFAVMIRGMCQIPPEVVGDSVLDLYRNYICCKDYNVSDWFKCGDAIRYMYDAYVTCTAPFSGWSCCAKVDEYGNRDYIGYSCNASRGVVSALMAVVAVFAVVLSSVM